MFLPASTLSYKTADGSVKLEASSHWITLLGPIVSLIMGWIFHYFM